MPPQELQRDTIEPCAAYCQSACDLIGKHLQAMKDETIDSSTDDAKLIPDKDKDKHLLKHWFMGIASQLIDDDDHPGYVSAKPGTSNTIPSCRECGAALQPGFNGSTVQLKRVTRPPRKRQPSRRKILHMNTSDKVCRNKLVVCCGTCERTTSYPGLPRRSKNNIDSTAKNMERKQSWINTVKNNKTKEKLMRNELKSSNGSKDSAAAAAAAAASLEQNLDFVPLGAPVNTARKIPSYKNFRSPLSYSESLPSSSPPPPAATTKRLADLGALHNPSKKNKIKKPKKQQSQLYDFLSSLNN